MQPAKPTRNVAQPTKPVTGKTIGATSGTKTNVGQGPGKLMGKNTVGQGPGNLTGKTLSAKAPAS